MLLIKEARMFLSSVTHKDLFLSARTIWRKFRSHPSDEVEAR